MEMTISAVQLGASSQPQAKTSDTGFSDVLSEVRTAAPQAQQNFTSQPYEQSDVSEPAEVSLADGTAAETQITVESLSVDFESTVVQLISGLSDGSKEDADRVISALLEILKKMQNKSEDDSSIDLVMELLASMLGETQEKPVFDFTFTSTETTVTAVSTELTAILSAENDIPVQTAVESTPVQSAADNNVQAQEAEIPAVQTESQVQEQPQVQAPAEGYEKLLNDILNAARKELGLTKAEFTAVSQSPRNEAPQTETLRSELPQTELPQTETPVQPRTETASTLLRLNHKDGTDELNSILNGSAEEAPEVKQETVVTAVQDNSAAMTGSTLQQTEAVAAEPEVKVEAPLPEQQIADEILSRPETADGGRTEFTMELNPESLGKITVKLVSAEGRVEVSITAENDTTRQLLETRADNIGAALRSNGVELERYQVVSGQEDAQLMQESYDGSSRNPYGRNDDENQQNEDDENDFLEILQQL